MRVRMTALLANLSALIAVQWDQATGSVTPFCSTFRFQR